VIKELLEIMLSQRGFKHFICYDGTDKWKFCMKSILSFLSTTWIWALSQYSTGKLVPAKFVTTSNIDFYNNTLIYMSQLDSTGLAHLDALLTDLRDVYVLASDFDSDNTYY
jgi:hypothetical protein